MRRGKKVLIIVLVVVLIGLSLVAAGLFLFNKEQEEIARKEEEEIINAEENFKNQFLNLEYTKNENDAITLSYNVEKDEEGKYQLDANLPVVNIETDVAKAINGEIINIFGRKLVEIVEESTVYTKYSVDYISYTNDNIMSLIIKATLKEGGNAQRLMVQTYNYDLEQNKLLNLKEYIDMKQLDQNIIQTQIINYVRGKSEAVDTALAEKYNLYIRDIRSEEYLIENIKTYYIGQDGKLYILFPYGNNNFTDTVDVVIVK